MTTDNFLLVLLGVAIGWGSFMLLDVWWQRAPYATRTLGFFANLRMLVEVLDGIKARLGMMLVIMERQEADQIAIDRLRAKLHGPEAKS